MDTPMDGESGTDVDDEIESLEKELEGIEMSIADLKEL